jgi:hypothetical protein
LCIYLPYFLLPSFFEIDEGSFEVFFAYFVSEPFLDFAVDVGLYLIEIDVVPVALALALRQQSAYLCLHLLFKLGK